jgi:hydrogenase maturation protease
MHTVIVGMGNVLFGDDGVGIVVARSLARILGNTPGVSVEETGWGGLRIIDLLAGHQRAFIVDALQSGVKPPGHLHTFDGSELVHSVRMVSYHDVNFATAVEFARQVGIPMPGTIIVHAVEVERTDSFSESLTPAVAAAVEPCVKRILSELRRSGPVISSAPPAHASRVRAAHLLTEQQEPQW